MRIFIMAKDFSRAFYNSGRWHETAKAYAKSVNYLCEDCLKQGILKPGEIVHHVIELTPSNITNPKIALGFNNLCYVCRECHAKRHGYRQKRYKLDAVGRVIIKR